MPISRLRLRFSAAFALVLAVTLGLFVTAGVLQQWRESHRRLDDRLFALAVAVDHALVQELNDRPASSLADAAAAVVRRWPHHEDGFAVLDSGAQVIATRDPRGLARRALAARATASRDRFDLPEDGDDGRAVRRRAELEPRHASAGRVDVLVFDSTEDIERDIESLSATLLVAVPLLALLSLGAGYALSGRALRPMERFVRETAHQIRTPLTLVLGEAEHALSTDRTTTTESEQALARVLVAAEQMRRRVDDLMLFAEAESGAAFERTDDVELDDLAFECTDLMRRRADALGRQLALGALAPVTVRGNAALLREALLELLENACRHGGAASPVTVGTEVHSGEAELIVRSALPDGSAPSTPGSGLGVPILDWIAAGHGGRIVRATRGGVYEARLILSIG